jgi:hypothetical protein
MPIRSSLFLILLLAGPLPAFQEPKRESQFKPALTEEEKEILKNRELLENLDLLQNVEKFRYFGYFAANEASNGPQGQNTAVTRKEAKKEEKKKR